MSVGRGRAAGRRHRFAAAVRFAEQLIDRRQIDELGVAPDVPWKSARSAATSSEVTKPFAAQGTFG